MRSVARSWGVSVALPHVRVAVWVGSGTVESVGRVESGHYCELALRQFIHLFTFIYASYAAEVGSATS